MQQLTVNQLKEDYGFEQAIIGSHGWKEILTPFPLGPNDYIEFAEADISDDDSLRAALNALGNIKRAADCQADTLMTYWGIFDLAKNENYRFHHKLELIKDIGILAPSLLNGINTYRNSAEHDYSSPDIDKVRDYLDMVSIFIEYSNRYLKLDIDNSEIITESEEAWIKVNFDNNKGEFSIKLNYDPEEQNGFKKWRKTEDIKYTVDSELDEYIAMLGLWYSAADY